MSTVSISPSIASNRIVIALVVAGLVASGVVGFLYSFDDAGAQWPQVPPAQDALTQAIDLNSISTFHYVNDSYVVVTDEIGNRFAMKFTAPCPGFRTAKDFSLITESYRNLDRFTAASVGGQTCTFRDFALEH